MRINLTHFRPTLSSVSRLPFSVRSLGRRCYLPYRKAHKKTVNFVQIIWSMHGTGAMEMNGVERTLNPGQAGIYFPGNEHHYYALEEPWTFCWWTLDGPLATSVAAALGLTAGQIYNPGTVPQATFNSLVNAMRNITPSGEYRASTLAYQLLVHLARAKNKTAANPFVAAAVDIIHARWNDSKLGVDQIARELKLHRSSFSRMFHSSMGISPLTYLINLRTQNALNLLSDRRYTVDEVARACGWDTPAYFSRCIRRATGLSPREIRRQ